jgi:hypothetical protein
MKVTATLLLSANVVAGKRTSDLFKSSAHRQLIQQRTQAQRLDDLRRQYMESPDEKLLALKREDLISLAQQV